MRYACVYLVGTYRDPASGGFSGTQCGQALPLFMQYAPVNQTAAVVAVLGKALAASNNHFRVLMLMLMILYPS